MTTPGPAVPVGTIVLAAWDANHFIDLDRPGALDNPYVRARLGRWVVAGYYTLTGSHSLRVEGSDGPYFSACPAAFVTPEEAGQDAAEAAAGRPGTWTARHVERGWYMEGVGAIETVTTHPGRAPGHASVTFIGRQGHRTFGLDTLVEAARPGT